MASMLIAMTHFIDWNSKVWSGEFLVGKAELQKEGETKISYPLTSLPK